MWDSIEIAMFNSRIKKARLRAVEGARPILSIIQAEVGLPSTFWSNDYILNFFMSLSGHFGALDTGGVMRSGDALKIIPSVLTTLSHQNGDLLFMNGFKSAQTLDGARGGELGSLCFMAGTGVAVDPTSSPLYSSALEFAKAIENTVSPTSEQILSALIHNILIPDIRARF